MQRNTGERQRSWNHSYLPNKNPSAPQILCSHINCVHPRVANSLHVGSTVDTDDGPVGWWSKLIRIWFVQSSVEYRAVVAGLYLNKFRCSQL
ncbi:hypothetical protein Mapa_014603 [Marchantia paleacea]|nr:hypothetical protein Mapa_014603 [Marchantia paleacea]